jgi:hypothetical protein
LWIETVRLVEPVDVGDREDPVDDAGLREEHEPDERDRDRGGDRREIEQGPEATATAEEALVDEEREEQREERLDRNDDQHVVEGVAERDREVATPDARLGEQLAVVAQPDRLRLERRAEAGPVPEADPHGQQDRDREEHDQTEQRGRREQPAGEGVGAGECRPRLCGGRCRGRCEAVRRTVGRADVHTPHGR